MTLVRLRIGMAAATLAVAALVGCYRGSARAVSLAEIDRQPGWSLVRGVRPLEQQEENDCGAAALAMVLERWGIPDASAEIRRTIVVQAGHGMAAGALRQFARDKGLRAFLISGVDADLEKEIQANRPVLVGLVQRYVGNKALTHYEVVIGLNRSTGRLLLLDPGRGPREDALASFDSEWRDAGRLTLVVAPS